MKGKSDSGNVGFRQKMVLFTISCLLPIYPAEVGIRTLKSLDSSVITALKLSTCYHSTRSKNRHFNHKNADISKSEEEPSQMLIRFESKCVFLTSRF